MRTLRAVQNLHTGSQTLQELIDAPTLKGRLKRVAGPVEHSVSSVALVDDVGRLDSVAPGALVVLPEGISRDLLNYRLDMALRLAGSSGAAGLVLTDGREEIAATAETIADRSRVAVLGAAAGSDLAALLLEIHRELAGGAEAALARIATALADLLDAEQRQSDPPRLLEVAAQALAAPLELRPPNPEDIAAPVMAEEDVEGYVCVPRPGGDLEAAAEVVAHLTANAVARARAAARRAEEMPALSRGELLAEFLLSGADSAERLLDRLRAAGVAIDWWHAVVRIEVDGDAATKPEDELASYQLRQRIGRFAFDAARSAGGIWQGAQVGPAFVLVKMERRDPGADSGRELAAQAGEILKIIRARLESVSFVCGLGSAHQGPTGLRASAAEAHAAVAAARTAQRKNAPVSFDGVGLQRTVIEWYAGDTARDMVDRMLAPLDRLGERKAEESIRTLQLYLDSQGSTARTAQLLHLHRNAVAYRIKRIFDLLDVDPADSDTRLLLQLACRARFLRPS